MTGRLFGHPPPSRSRITLTTLCVPDPIARKRRSDKIQEGAERGLAGRMVEIAGRLVPRAADKLLGLPCRFDSTILDTKGIAVPRTRRVAQDDVRENRLVDLFNLSRPADRSRHGTDAFLAVDEQIFEFELKSVTTGGGGVSTVRDLGPDHIAKWRGKHWIIGIYDELDLLSCKYGSPDPTSAVLSKTVAEIRRIAGVATRRAGLWC
jgi:hypothetical protein